MWLSSPEQDWTPPVVDTSKSSVARIYNYFLGEKDNFSCDRQAAKRVAAALPDMETAACENRSFLARAIRYLIEQGVDQFLDIGTGLPTQGHLHQVVAEHCPDARVVYVDNDQIVLSHARALIPSGERVTVVDGDLRDPLPILNDPATRRLIDFTRPVGVLLVAVLHFVTEVENPGKIVEEFVSRLAPDSFVVLSHATCEEPSPDAVAEVEAVYADASSPLTFRTREQIAELFTGTDLVAPGLRYLPRWRPDPRDQPRRHSRLLLGGVGITPGRAA